MNHKRGDQGSRRATAGKESNNNNNNNNNKIYVKKKKITTALDALHGLHASPRESWDGGARTQGQRHRKRNKCGFKLEKSTFFCCCVTTILVAIICLKGRYSSMSMIWSGVYGLLFIDNERNHFLKKKSGALKSTISCAAKKICKFETGRCPILLRKKKPGVARPSKGEQALHTLHRRLINQVKTGRHE